jgi:hypothetical protein
MSDTKTFRSSTSHVDTAATRGVLMELLEERRHQIDDHGWTPEHDDNHASEDFAWLCARRAVEMCHADAYTVVDVRRLFVEISAIAIAAIEMLDRKVQR